MLEKVSINKLREKEGRGKFLTIMLVIYAVYIINNILYLFRTDLFNVSITKIFLSNLGQGVALLFHIVILIGIFRWKKAAVYGFFLLPTLQILYINLIVIPKSTFFITLLYAFAGVLTLWALLSLWFFALKRKWHLFL